MKHAHKFAAILLLVFLGAACASPSALTSDQMTHVAGVVLDSDYDRIANATISFTSNGQSVTTGENGIFTARDVSVGTQTVTIEADGFGTVEKRVEVTNGGTRLQLMLD
jgi:hypothetical protein